MVVGFDVINVFIMAHIHHSFENQKTATVRQRLMVAFALNLLFTVIEFVGGIFTNSMAILSDAIHDLGDTVAIGGSLWLEKVAERKRDKRFTYGYKRFSTLGALITSIILVIGSVVIIFEALPRFIQPQEVKATGMMWMAVLGIVFNGIAVLRLQGGGKSLNNRAVMLHLLEDVLGWVAVLVGSILIHFTGWYIIDPLLSLGVAAFILYNVVGNLKRVFRVFLQSTPEGFDYDALEVKLLAIKGVHDIHDVHIWSMDGSYHIMSLHLVVGDAVSSDTMKSLRLQADVLIREAGINHPTIAIEFEEEACHSCDA